MKQNREAGGEDEASAQLDFFFSAQTLTPAVVFLAHFTRSLQSGWVCSAADVAVGAC